MNRRRRLRSLIAHLLHYDVTFAIENNRVVVSGLTPDSWLTGWLERNQLHLLTILLRQQNPAPPGLPEPRVTGEDDEIPTLEDLEALLSLYKPPADETTPPADADENRQQSAPASPHPHRRTPASWCL